MSTHLLNSRFSKGLLYTLGCSFLWAWSIVIQRFVLKTGENSLNTTVWIGLFNFLPWSFLFLRHTAELKTLSRRALLLLLFIGIAGSIGINYLQALALEHTSAVNFAFLYRTVVVFTIFFAWIFFKEKITHQKILITCIILIGSYLLTTNGQSLRFSQGDMYTLLMAASGAFIGNILIKHTIAQMHVDLSGSVTAVVATTTLLSLALITGVFRVPQHLFLLFVTGMISWVQILLRNRGYKYATASFVTMVVSSTPLFVAIISYFLLGEALKPVELLGGGLIVGSVFLVEKLKI